MGLAHIGHRLQRVENASPRFAMDHDHMGDAFVGQQVRLQHLGTDRRIFGKRDDGGAPPHQVGEFGRPLAISTVVKHQHVAVSRHHRGHRCFDAEGATALQGHHHMAVVSMHDVQQALAHPGGDGDEVAVPRAPIFEHGQFGAQTGGQGSGGEQDGFAVCCHGNFIQKGGSLFIKISGSAPDADR